MSSFTAPAIVEVKGSYDFRLVENFEYYITDEQGEKITVPKGFVTDFASVPRIFWNIFPPIGRYTKACIIHDYMYDNAIKTKKEADLIFYQAMDVLGVPKWKRLVMYWAVRVFGRGEY